MSEIRQMVAFDDIVVGEDFNGRVGFRAFVKKAFVDVDGCLQLRPAGELLKVLDGSEQQMLDKLRGLSASLDKHGLLAPLVVREGGPARTDGKRRYFLIAGERRLRAIGLLRETSPNKFKQVEIKLKKCNAADSETLNLIENLQRESLEPMEAARGMKHIMDSQKLTQAQLALTLGKSEPYVSQHLALLRAAPEVQKAIEAGDITPTIAREVAPLPAENQKEVIKALVDKKAPGKKISTQDAKDEADKHKAALGIKHERERKPKDGGPDFDREKIKAAKEVIADKPIVMRTKNAVLERYGLLRERLGNPNLGEDKRAVYKAEIRVLDWFLGLRDLQ
jgi:ParB/RepB/Spo0J family partition protein